MWSSLCVGTYLKIALKMMCWCCVLDHMLRAFGNKVAHETFNIGVSEINMRGSLCYYFAST